MIRSLEPPSFLCPSLESMRSFHTAYMEPPSSHRLNLQLLSSLQPQLSGSFRPSLELLCFVVTAWSHRVPSPSLKPQNSFHPGLEPPRSHRLSLELLNSLHPSLEPSSSHRLGMQLLSSLYPRL